MEAMPLYSPDNFIFRVEKDKQKPILNLFNQTYNNGSVRFRDVLVANDNEIERFKQIMCYVNQNDERGEMHIKFGDDIDAGAYEHFYLAISGQTVTVFKYNDSELTVPDSVDKARTQTLLNKLVSKTSLH